MVRKIIGTPQNQPETFIGGTVGATFIGQDLSANIDYETITITPRRTTPITTRLSIHPEVPIEIVSDHLGRAMSLLLNRFIELLADDILVEPIRVAVEHNVADDSYNIGIRSTRTIPREYQQYAPAMRNVLNRDGSNSVVFPRIARR
jgi:hypothetical protein